jgi:hypothetical protein
MRKETEEERVALNAIADAWNEGLGTEEAAKEPWGTETTIRTETVRPYLRPAVERFAHAHINWHDLFAAGDNQADFLVDPILPRGRSVSFYGPAKVGKSELINAAAAGLASGRSVFGQPAGEPIPVLYLDQEMGRDDLLDRLTAMDYGPDELDLLHYYQLADLPALDTAEGGQTLLELVRAHSAQLVVMDTIGRLIAGSENDADTYLSYFRHTGAPLKAAMVASARLDHSGKDQEKGQRGSSAKNDDVDIVWKVSKRDNGRVQLQATHRRIDWVPEKVEFQRHTEPLRHVRVEGTWPPGTAEIADRLDTIGVPLDAGRPKAREALISAGLEPGRNETLAAALRFRRSTLRRCPVEAA